jgi:hypothetical protein
VCVCVCVQVEVVYYGPQEYDSPTAATIIYHLADGTGISVKFIDGQSVAPSGTKGLEPHRAPGRITGFKAKVHALVWVTSFDQVSLTPSAVCGQPVGVRPLPGNPRKNIKCCCGSTSLFVVVDVLG